MREMPLGINRLARLRQETDEGMSVDKKDLVTSDAGLFIAQQVGSLKLTKFICCQEHHLRLTGTWT